MQVADRLFPIAVVDQIVPVRDLVVDRTPRRPMAIGNAAIHAARRLLGDFLVAHPDGELAEVANPVRRRLILRRLPIDFEKTGYLAHVAVLFT
jgi:hypothetical protein